MLNSSQWTGNMERFHLCGTTCPVKREVVLPDTISGHPVSNYDGTGTPTRAGPEICHALPRAKVVSRRSAKFKLRASVRFNIRSFSEGTRQGASFGSICLVYRVLQKP